MVEGRAMHSFIFVADQVDVANSKFPDLYVDGRLSRP